MSLCNFCLSAAIVTKYSSNKFIWKVPWQLQRHNISQWIDSVVSATSAAHLKFANFSINKLLVTIEQDKVYFIFYELKKIAVSSFRLFQFVIQSPQSNPSLDWTWFRSKEQLDIIIWLQWFTSFLKRWQRHWNIRRPRWTIQNGQHLHMLFIFISITLRW